MAHHPSTPTPHFSAIKTGLAFRPFFWLGALFVVMCMSIWWSFWRGNVSLHPLGGMIWWHQHEMLFGFVAAIVAGFLLTAVQTWTGLPSLKGVALWLVVLLWGVARLLIAYPMGVAPIVIMMIDVAFLVVVALCMASLVIRAKKWRNLVFVPLLAILCIANAGMHWGQMNGQAAVVLQSAYLAMWLFISIVIIVGGRVIPFFTARALNLSLAPSPKFIELLTIISTFSVCVFQLLRMCAVQVPGWLFAIPLALLVVLNSKRLAGWGIGRCWPQPLLWGLHLSYAFVILGSFLWLLAELNLVAVDLALHTLSIGVLLAIILAMTARVSLGHTGRPMQALPGLSLALGCLFVAALLRGVVLWAWPQGVLWIYQASLVLSIMAFLWFLVQYTIPLWSARVDQRPG